METNDTTPGSLRREVVDAYFDIKMTEARIDGNEDYLNFLTASQRLWENNRSLHVKLASDIARWDATTMALNESVITQNLYIPPQDGPLTQLKESLLHTPSRSATEAVLMVGFSALLLIATLLITLLGNHPESWIGVAISVLNLAYSLRQAQLYRSSR